MSTFLVTCILLDFNFSIDKLRYQASHKKIQAGEWRFEKPIKAKIEMFMKSICWLKEK
jgi:hypothetical protein